MWGESKKRRNYNRMSKKVPDRMPASTITDAKELKFCIQGWSKEVNEDTPSKEVLKEKITELQLPVYITCTLGRNYS